MAYKDNISRLSRLTALLIKLQSQSFVSIERLSEEFNVSKRTVYRDLRALEEAGVPISQNDKDAYGIVDGYNIPPIMFSEAEANALIFGEKMIERTKDESLIQEFKNAVSKIKAVLKSSEKMKAELLAERTIIGKNWQNERTSNLLSNIQKALTNFEILKIEYQKDGSNKASSREIEPFAIYHNTFENWVLIAWCRLRNDFRNFRLDRIKKLTNLKENFQPHSITMEEYNQMQYEQYLKRLEED
ncbi:MAG: WYL domain-containing protein [Flavobacteriales bacterium]|nr:WYL domain-containing protein [Flavobacteriales bacterium]